MSVGPSSGYVPNPPREMEAWVLQTVYVPPSVMALDANARRQWAIRSIPPQQRCVIEAIPNNDPTAGPAWGHVWIHLGYGATRVPGWQPGAEACVDIELDAFMAAWKRL